MLARLRTFSERYLYNDETHRILNLLTLEIKDKAIAEEYELYRTMRYRAIYWPFVIFVVVLTVMSWLQYFFGEGALAHAIRPLHLQMDVLLLTFCRLFFKKDLVQAQLICPLFTLIQVQLAFRGYLPGHDTSRLLQGYQYMYIIVPLVFATGNYNAFKTTLLVFPPIQIVFFHF
jgi:hypothetical protein